MTTTGVKALCFDVFGTVVDWRSSIAREAQAAGLKVDGDAFALAWRAKYQPAMEQIRLGHRPWTKLDILHRENLEATLAEFGVAGLDEAALDHLNRGWHRLSPWADVVEGLTRLKRKFILATCSNGNVSLMVNLAKHSGLPWDAVLGAETSQAFKPQPQAYLGTSGLLGLDPAECMMVAAHNGDLVAASGVGFRTAFVARPTEYGTQQNGKDLKAEHDFDVVASDFGDLAAKLGC